ncbi:SurA N-terminal domain-containing protein [Paenalkalicoccus suaedae]|uniref:SurA N-terminal domain-containing protein n=1 Tax=Paenalkalicoccus suaedae TaxID=2592382 RepID=A0A859FFR4_9BACI|nr:SurA N-terminal domain-containing protein [Paenalkalicoccus suaedae]QKS71055.1 SurA N-terminal domain-containing protein [Paenalkalicoccus suaedae]
MKRFSKKAILTTTLSAGLLLAACSTDNDGGNDQVNNTNNAATNTEENVTEVEGNEGNANTDGENNLDGEAQPEDVPNVMDQDPDEPVAIVNGEEIPYSELQAQVGPMQGMMGGEGEEDAEQDAEMQAMMAQMSQQILDQLVVTRLLVQEAEAQGIEADDEMVNQELEELKASFETEEAFQEALEQQQYTEEQIEEEIRDITRVEELLTLAHLEEGAYEVTEEEVQAFYEQMAAQNPEMEEFDTIQPELEEQLEQQAYLEDLRANAEIEILL